MRRGIVCFFLSVCLPLFASGQTRQDGSYQVYGGYTWLSNSFNGLPGHQQGLNGWETSLGLPETHGMRFVLDYVSLYGTNQGASQKGFFAMAGGEYEHRLGRERLFAEGLVGDATLNKSWYKQGQLVSKASFTEFLGAGLDTPLTHSLAFRVKGGVQHTNFALMTNRIDGFPYFRPAGLPENFGRISAGVVWTHHRSSAAEAELIREEEDPANHLKDSQLVFEGEGSFGHYTIFAGSHASYLHEAGVEYDRHTWGYLWGAQMDYVGEIMPLVLLKQPTSTNAYGNDLNRGIRISYETVPGLAITPIGLKMTWLHKRRISPFVAIKGGMIFFTQKALSKVASYEDFTLQETIGSEVKVTPKWGLRLGIGDYHFSNAFVVPSDPGIDVAMWKVGLVYQLGKTKWFR